MIGSSAIQPSQQIPSLSQTLAELAHQSLLDLPGHRQPWEAARDWLARRGFDLDQLDLLPVGFFPDCATMRSRLQDAGFSPEVIDASELVADPRLDGRLVGPIRDYQGCIKGFWARDSARRKPQYLFKGSWKEEVAAFGLDVAYPALAQHKRLLVLVEGFFDALLIQSRGFPNVAAIGGAALQMTASRWNRLAVLGVRRVILIPSMARVSQRDALLARDTVASLKPAPKVFVLPLERLDEMRTPGEFVRVRGIEAFRAILQPPAPQEPPVRNEPSVGKEPSVRPRPCITDNRSKDGFCALHHCHETVCFCFD